MTSTTESLIDEIVELHTLTMREKYTGDLETLLGRCESPIEKVFGAALLHELFACDEFKFDLYEYRKDWDEGGARDARVLIPQFEIGRYRVDFFVHFYAPQDKSINIAIECDGHDFHERTKEQASRDKTKDRWLQCHGYNVLRFTGAEIWKDPVNCAEQVLKLIFNRVFW